MYYYINFQRCSWLDILGMADFLLQFSKLLFANLLKLTIKVISYLGLFTSQVTPLFDNDNNRNNIKIEHLELLNVEWWTSLLYQIVFKWKSCWQTIVMLDGNAVNIHFVFDIQAKEIHDSQFTACPWVYFEKHFIMN